MITLIKAIFSYCMKEVGKLKNTEKDQIGQLARMGIEVKDGKKYECRFGYPKPLIGYKQTFEDSTCSNQVISSSVRDPQKAPDGAMITHKNMEKKCGPKVLRMARNHMTVSNHVPELSLVHRGNHDAQAINHQRQLKEYVTKVIYSHD